MVIFKSPLVFLLFNPNVVFSIQKDGVYMSFSTQDIDAVWDKLNVISDAAESKGFRKDMCSAWILRSEYGNRSSNYGWEIDHITAKANGGLDNLSNLRALHWKNNASRQDGRLNTQKPAVKGGDAQNLELDVKTDTYKPM
jgi:hypothetical protein